MCLYLVSNEVILNSLHNCHGNRAMTMAMNKVQLDALLLENIENATPSLLSSCFSALGCSIHCLFLAAMIDVMLVYTLNCV